MAYIVWAYSRDKMQRDFPIDDDHQATFYNGHWAKVANRRGRVHTFVAKEEAEALARKLSTFLSVQELSQGGTPYGLAFKADKDVQ
jgi:hypothetical protein